MSSLIQTGVFAVFLTTATALNGIVAPSNVEAGQNIRVTFQNANDNQYRVYLAASLADSNGPTCYLINSTTLSDSVNVSIPPDVGPSADYYSIAIADITTSQGPAYSNPFNLSGTTGEYSDYEDHLGGSPFWSADDLPCTAYSCARQCAQASYPADLTDDEAYMTMKSCILDCDDVTSAAIPTSPAHASAPASSITGPATLVIGEMAVITLGSSVMTAMRTGRVEDGTTITEAVIGDLTITLGGAAGTVGNQGVTLATDIMVVGETKTVKFTSTLTTIPDAAPTTEEASAPTTDGAGCVREKYRLRVAAAGFAGLVLVL